MPRHTITAVFPLPLLLILLSIASSAWGFIASSQNHHRHVVVTPSSSSSFTRHASSSTAGMEGEGGDPSEIIARKIVVCGDVDGGYFRSCVKNEGSRFRKLIGTMTPPDDSKKAEILVEGRRKMVDGFVRWCQRGNVGLSQAITVESVVEEEPTGLYDDFYVPTGRDN
mmetsp:Transcript_19630/g.27955  ORF Transcript_19630/g.27955 Transcript_19630/m.27955 type:complete len:168 (-) Transcript_19630:227-730(-)|eukprot:CAMPEP_0201693078 /NCGR_PEP_ID=MMETSP0578-20130828/5775_1 /ASSEMBLY_ACC=CAM_ASM_000663 /TAXON_ID=267565 /ORGANISM="Skeletonema grethea, Strain CCMP 1804" /LENGTH=167 /DNA_ID=CAMNT_0048178541 /DNA_START=103 /DNA_END=606 /DNA_ORIENTATION=+